MSQVVTEILIVFLLTWPRSVFTWQDGPGLIRKTRLLTRAEDGDVRAITALALLDKPNRLLSTVQIFITTIGIFSGALGGQAAGSTHPAAVKTSGWLNQRKGFRSRL